MAKRYDVISPDGFSIDREDTYKTIKEAKDAMEKWIKRYEQQGYYSSNSGRIELYDVHRYCKIITV